ncbi:MAG: FAD:protein FMN transferase [Acidimicrobiia bacterium]
MTVGPSAAALATPDVDAVAWPVMGTDGHVVVVGGDPGEAAWARDRIDALEARWTRFRADSELSRLNESRGRPVRVSADTFAVIQAAVDAWRRSDGRFDPTVLTALVHAGYDRPFALGLDRPQRVEGAREVPGCGAIDLDPVVHAVTLPHDTCLDLGGIGKGFAADLVAVELVARGAAGAMVNLGGDLRAIGDGPTGHGWTVAVEHTPGAALVVTNAGIATSATTRRTWSRGSQRLHHVVDPATGRPAAAPAAAVTVVAATAAEAEVVATAALLAGRGALDAIVAAGGSGIVLGPDGTRWATPDLRAIVAD